MKNNSIDLKNRIVLLTGASRGIGNAIAQRLYSEGCLLSLGVRDVAAMQEMTSKWQTDRVLVCHYDATVSASAKKWINESINHYGQIDVLINNAGVLHDFDLLDADESKLDDMWNINVKGPLALVRHSFEALKKSGHGRVINIVSLSGKRVKSGAIAGYAMTKHAALAFTHAVRQHGWDAGIRATAVCPGYVATDMTADVQSFPINEMSPPGAIAEMVAMLLTLPNTANIAELPVNCVLESQY